MPFSAIGTVQHRRSLQVGKWSKQASGSGPVIGRHINGLHDVSKPLFVVVIRSCIAPCRCSTSADNPQRKEYGPSAPTFRTQPA